MKRMGNLLRQRLLGPGLLLRWRPQWLLSSRLAEPALFHQLLEKMARSIHRRTEQVSRLFPGRLWRIYGPEYATPPYLPDHIETHQ